LAKADGKKIWLEIKDHQTFSQMNELETLANNNFRLSQVLIDIVYLWIILVKAKPLLIL